MVHAGWSCFNFALYQRSIDSFLIMNQFSYSILLLVISSSVCFCEDSTTSKRKLGIQLKDNIPITCRAKYDTMFWYQGLQNFSASERPCLHWSDPTLKHDVSAEDFGEPIEDVENHCRNPNDSPCGPWCFVDINGNKLPEPCFPTCYSEKYSNKSMRCTSHYAWSDAAIVSKNEPEKRFDKMLTFFATDVLQSNCAGDFLSYDFLYYDNVPVVGIMPNSPWGYTCYIGNPLTLYPTLVKCEDLQLDCIRKEQMEKYNYQGTKSFAVDGRPCINWQRAARDDFGNMPKRDTHLYNGKYKILLNSAMNARCLNLHITSEDDWAQDDKFRIGPMCFVEKENSTSGKIEPAPCFLNCDDFILDKMNCTEYDEFADIEDFEYNGLKRTTANEEPCEQWKVQNQTFQKNFCRVVKEFADLGPSCYTKDSTTPQRCFGGSCKITTKSIDSVINLVSYNCCSEPGFERYCDKYEPEPRTQTPEPKINIREKIRRRPKSSSDSSQSIPEVGEMSYGTYQEDRVPEEFRDEVGTLSEILPPTFIAEIIIWVVYLSTVTVLVVLWRKVYIEDRDKAFHKKKVVPKKTPLKKTKKYWR